MTPKNPVCILARVDPFAPAQQRELLGQPGERRERHRSKVAASCGRARSATRGGVVLHFFFSVWLVSQLMPPSTASGATWSESGWQAKQWKGRRSGTWGEEPWAQWTAGGWQGKWTGSWWDADSWKADPPAGPAGGRDGGASDGERASDEQEEPEECPWEHCVAKEDSAEDDAGPSGGPRAGHPPDADELRALHEAALRRFLDDGDEPPGSDTEVAPSGAARPEQAALPEVIPIHGAAARCAFYNPTTGGVDCQLCAMHLNSLKQWEDHRTGKKHVKKLSNPKLAACEPPPVPVAST